MELLRFPHRQQFSLVELPPFLNQPPHLGGETPVEHVEVAYPLPPLDIRCTARENEGDYVHRSTSLMTIPRNRQISGIFSLNSLWVQSHHIIC